ncbi:MAG: HEAT repeat domain-containing protein [Calditrichaeota bacterium]|nr:HEAT repeat domain-containing protein [Calditrichota bacterium]
MKKNDVREWLPDYLMGTLDPAKQETLATYLEQNPDVAREFESLAQLWSKLGDLPEAAPSPALKVRFNAMLEAYAAGQKHAGAKSRLLEALDSVLERFWPKRLDVQFGLSLALLLVGLFLGYNLNSTPKSTSELGLLKEEVFNLRQMVTTSLLQNESTSERLRGVSYSYRIHRPDDNILNALSNTLNYDESLNVRLAAIDALALYYERQPVRQQLIESLSRQTSPLIQIALIDLLVENREREGIQTLTLLKNNEKLNPSVRRRAGKALEAIQK